VKGKSAFNVYIRNTACAYVILEPGTSMHWFWLLYIIIVLVVIHFLIYWNTKILSVMKHKIEFWCIIKQVELTEYYLLDYLFFITSW